MPGERWTSSRPGLHLDQNVLGLLRRDSPGLDSGPLGWPLFRCRTARSAPAPRLVNKLKRAPVGQFERAWPRSVRPVESQVVVRYLL